MLTCLLFGSVVLLLMFLIPSGAKLFHTPRAKPIYQIIVFTFYLGGILWLTLFNRWGMEVYSFRFKPFYVVRQIANCLFGFQKISVSVCKALFHNSSHLLDSVHATPVEDLLLNIILFMPLGFLLTYFCPKLKFWHILLISILLSSSIETTQYLAHWGCFDIDDIFNNTLGACIGHICYRLYHRVFH